MSASETDPIEPHCSPTVIPQSSDWKQTICGPSVLSMSRLQGSGDRWPTSATLPQRRQHERPWRLILRGSQEASIRCASETDPIEPHCSPAVVRLEADDTGPFSTLHELAPKLTRLMANLRNMPTT